jgi:outer membrane protein OmpA-like peptidoglycan-associated protein
MQKSLPIIETIAELLATHPEWNLTVEGHTDNSGSKETNLELSRKRAETVTNLLVKMGIDRSRLKYTGYGASQPLTTESSREAMAANRRVTFRLN